MSPGGQIFQLSKGIAGRLAIGIVKNSINCLSADCFALAATCPDWKVFEEDSLLG